MVGCLGNLIYLAGDDAEKRKAILAEYAPIGKNLHADGPDNPRVLWIVGGLQLGAPPPTGGDPFKAAARCARASSAPGARLWPARVPLGPGTVIVAGRAASEDLRRLTR